MNEIIKIIELLIWPVTLILITLILRKALIDLLPKLSKLKYKELELDFEQQAKQLQAEVERDVPEIKPKEKIDDGIRYSLKREKIEPYERIHIAWQNIEEETIALIKRHNIKLPNNATVRTMAEKLQSSGVLEQPAAEAMLEISAFRNKVTHSDSSFINEEVADAIEDAAKRLTAYFNVL